MVFAVTASRRAAAADMAKPSIDVAEMLARLSASTIFELRGKWRRLHRAPPPMRLSRDLLMHGITYKLQERPLGGLTPATARRALELADGSAPGALAKPQPMTYLAAGLLF